LSRERKNLPDFAITSYIDPSELVKVLIFLETLGIETLQID